jgi:outer membrane protein assembly factor BamE (lipoprotein component of BamABCDE complex)
LTVTYLKEDDMKTTFLLLISALIATACTSAGQHRAAVQDDTQDRMTVGTVQKEIFLGMTGADVLSVIGSPNIVSTDAERNEVWVYDKLATDVAYSDSQAGVLGLIFGPIGAGGAAGAGAGTYSSGARSTSQRTLTVVINFDADKRVRDFAYHTSRF